jgi:hypothetical protein
VIGDCSELINCIMNVASASVLSMRTKGQARRVFHLTLDSKNKVLNIR